MMYEMWGVRGCMGGCMGDVCVQGCTVHGDICRDVWDM